MTIYLTPVSVRAGRRFHPILYLNTTYAYVRIWGHVVNIVLAYRGNKGNGLIGLFNGNFGLYLCIIGRKFILFLGVRLGRNYGIVYLGIGLTIILSAIFGRFYTLWGLLKFLRVVPRTQLYYLIIRLLSFFLNNIGVRRTIGLPGL